MGTRKRTPQSHDATRGKNDMRLKAKSKVFTSPYAQLPEYVPEVVIAVEVDPEDPGSPLPTVEFTYVDPVHEIPQYGIFVEDDGEEVIHPRFRDGE